MKASYTKHTDRPREKILNYGIDYLTTEELLSVILGSGSQHVKVSQLARKIEKLYLSKKDVTLSDLMEIKGIGLAKGCQILAGLELVERLKPPVPEDILDNAQKVLLHVHDLRTAEREHIVALYLNARHKLIHKEVLSIGSLNQAAITPREIFSVMKNAPFLYVILVHNHPTGDPTPSQDDLILTQRVAKAGEILGTKLLDHIIVSKTNHHSMKAHNQL